MNYFSSYTFKSESSIWLLKENFPSVIFMKEALPTMWKHCQKWPHHAENTAWNKNFKSLHKKYNVVKFMGGLFCFCLQVFGTSGGWWLAGILQGLLEACGLQLEFSTYMRSCVINPPVPRQTGWCDQEMFLQRLTLHGSLNLVLVL